jgi:hypothetical protein
LDATHTYLSAGVNVVTARARAHRAGDCAATTELLENIAAAQVTVS